MVKRFNQENFHIQMPDGKVYGFYCWTTHTRDGYCHTVYCAQTDQTTKTSYCGRTYECYPYQTTLHRAFKKFPAAHRKVFDEWDKQHEKEIGEQCDKMFGCFKAAYDAAPESTKQMLAQSDVQMNSEDDVKVVIGLLKLGTVLGT